jgi:endonuclease/exonuclease/phosphatase family metal-dependent hydrolase
MSSESQGFSIDYPGENRTLHVEVYNVHLFSPLVTAFESCVAPTSYLPNAALRLAALIVALQKTNADVVLLTEMWHFGYVKELTSKLTKTWPYWIVPPTGKRRGCVLPSGLLLLSKFRIGIFEFFPFRNYTGIDAWAEKGILLAYLGNGTCVLATHLQAPYVGHPNNEVRLKQLEQLIDCVKQYPVDIVMGDFNLNDTGSKFAMLEKALQENRGLQSCRNDKLNVNGFVEAPKLTRDRKRLCIFAAHPIWTATDPVKDFGVFQHAYCYYDPQGHLQDISDHLPFLSEISIKPLY